jgi:hypothetical protein
MKGSLYCPIHPANHMKSVCFALAVQKMHVVVQQREASSESSPAMSTKAQRLLGPLYPFAHHALIESLFQ